MMVTEKLGPVFSEYGFRPAGQWGYYSRFESADLAVVIGHAPTDHSIGDDSLTAASEASNLLFIGRNAADSEMIGIDDETLREVFGFEVGTTAGKQPGIGAAIGVGTGEKIGNAIGEKTGAESGASVDHGLSLRDCPVDLFLDRLLEFFQWEGSALLQGDMDKMEELEAYAAKGAAADAAGSINRGDSDESDWAEGNSIEAAFGKASFREADRAWAREDFEDFVAEMDAIDTAEWKPAYRMKYQMAQQFSKPLQNSIEYDPETNDEG